MRNNIIKPEHHGKKTGYNYGCRCAQCTEFHRISAITRLRENPDARDSNNKRVRDKSAERRAYISGIKMFLGCIDCGYRTHPMALEFDHLPGSKKLFNIGEMKLHSLEKLHREMDKCEVVCSNCHKIRTANRRGI